MTDGDVLARLQELLAQPNAAFHVSRPESPTVEEDLRAARREIAQLRVALEHRTIIGQATGILVERFGVNAETAFEALAMVSSQTNRRLYDIALELSQTGHSPGLDDRAQRPPRKS